MALKRVNHAAGVDLGASEAPPVEAAVAAFKGIEGPRGEPDDLTAHHWY